MSAKTESKPKRLKVITEKQLADAKVELSLLAWSKKRKQSQTAKMLDFLRDEIEKARAAGVSWPGITDEVNAQLGTSIHPATVRSYFTKTALTEKELDEAHKKGLDVESLHDQAASDLSSSHSPKISPV
jgi:hypothetical protein